MKELRFTPFLPMVSAFEPHSAPRATAAEILNYICEDGAIRPDYGYNNLQAAQGSFVAGYGLVHLHGKSAADANVEEYVSIENIGGTIRAYARNAASLAVLSAITGATGLHASRWRGFRWRSFGYFFNRNHATPLYRHIIGDNTSWLGINNAADPTVRLTYRIGHNDALASVYDQLSFAGLNMSAAAGEIVYTGRASEIPSLLNADGTVRIGCTAGVGLGAIKIDLSLITAGIQDYSDNDAFAFTITEGLSPNTLFHLRESNLKLTYINNDGSPLTFVPQVVAVRMASNRINVFVYCGPKTRAEWDNIRYWQLDFEVVSVYAGSTTPNSPNVFTIGLPYIGCTFPAGQQERLPGQVERFGYSFWNSVADLESGVAGAVDVPANLLGGYNPLGGTGGGPLPVPITPGGQVDPFGRLGTFIEFTEAASPDSSIDNNRLYWFSPSATWKRIVTQTDADLTYVLKMSNLELLALEDYLPRPFVFTGLVGGFPARGFVGWIYKGGKVRYSKVGTAETLASEEDDILDDEEGANFDLSFNFGDEGVGCGFQVDEAIIVPGYQGTYAHTGPKPLEMTPFRRVGPGCAGPDAACAFRDEGGNQGVAYVDSDGEGVWFVRSYSGVDADNWPKAIELTEPIRGQIRSFLIDAQVALSVTLAECELYFDQRRDALCLILGQRKLWLARKDILTSQRGWHRRSYNLGGGSVKFSAISASPTRGVRFMRSDGKVDEDGWNSTTSAFVQGSNRDGGNAMPAPSYRAQTFAGPWRRWIRGHIIRDTLTNVPTLQIISSRQTSSAIAVVSGLTLVNFPHLQQGYDHSWLLTGSENDGPIRMIVIEESAPLSKRGQ